MLYTICKEILSNRVNIHALETAQELSNKYRDYQFFYGAINDFADNLPEVATILECPEITEDEMKMIDIEYADLLIKKLKSYPRNYDGMTMTLLREFDNRWFHEENYGFYVKAGEFLSYL